MAEVQKPEYLEVQKPEYLKVEKSENPKLEFSLEKFKEIEDRDKNLLKTVSDLIKNKVDEINRYVGKRKNIGLSLTFAGINTKESAAALITAKDIIEKDVQKFLKEYLNEDASSKNLSDLFVEFSTKMNKINETIVDIVDKSDWEDGDIKDILEEFGIKEVSAADVEKYAKIIKDSNSAEGRARLDPLRKSKTKLVNLVKPTEQKQNEESPS